MGCGCGRSNITSVNKNRAIKPQSNTTPKADSNAACIQKYDELAVIGQENHRPSSQVQVCRRCK